LAGAGGGAMALATHERFWWLGAAVSGLAFLAVIWFQWGRDWVRTLRMRRPFTVHFTDPEGHNAFWEMYWPADSEVLVQLRIAPKLHYTQHELIFGFVGDQRTRPFPVSVINTFIKIGKHRTQSPKYDDGHSISHRDNYHIKETRQYTYPNVYTIGFLVRTRKPGRYPIRLEVITDCGEGKPVKELVFIVEDRSNGSSAS
jgi:hypothetical protein